MDVRIVTAEKFIPAPTRYMYNPLQDITTYELALIVPVIIHSHISGIVSKLPPEAKRHFREIKQGE